MESADSGRSEKRSYDLEERTARYGEAIIAFCRSLQKGLVIDPLIRQLVRSATSIGANYCEADDAVSKKEFRLKIATCKKESRETKYWLRMIAAAEDTRKDESRKLWTEAKELHLIFAAILRK
jgi:four helix bundle protein